MQETLPKLDLYNFYKIKKIKNKKTSFFVVIITIIITIIIILSSFIFKYKNDGNKSKKYYLLSLNQALNKKEAEKLKEQAEEIIDIAYICEKNGLFYVVGFIYESLFQAQTGLDSIKKSFEKARIIVIKQEKLKRRVFYQIKSNPKLYSAYRNINLVASKVLSLCQNAKMGGALAKIYRDLSRLELNLVSNKNQLEKLEKTKLVDSIKLSCEVLSSFIKSFKEEIVLGGSLVEKLKLLYFEVFFEIDELKKAL